MRCLMHLHQLPNQANPYHTLFSNSHKSVEKSVLYLQKGFFIKSRS